MKQADYDTLLAEEISQFYADPYGFVKFAFPWGEPDGPLAAYDGPDVWQETLLKRLGEEIRQRAFDGVKAVQPILMSVASGHGIGKGHSLPTPAYKLIMQSSNAKSEWTMQNVAWGDLKPGDYVYGADGNPTEIVATRHYKRPHYRVTFDDGASTVVSGEHEWQVRGRQERRKGLDTWRILETEEIIRLGVLRKNGSTMAKQWEIPVQKPIQFPEKAVFDPYTVGVWLGDGASSSGQISSTRHELWERIGIAPRQDTLRYKKDGTMTATIPGLVKALKKFGMAPTTCDNKFVARAYKYNSERVRREILSGLLDTDGEVTASGSICYSSTSKRLVEDVIWLTRSLGAKAQMQDAIKQTFYTRKDGTRSAPCKPCYRCTIAFGDGWNPFTHTYKRARLGENRVYQDRYTKRWIESIEPVGEMEGMCIEVAANDHLYLANDFIVTHNSSLTSWLILFVLSTRPHAKIIVTAGTQNQLADKTWAELAKWHKMAINGHWFTYYNSRGNLVLFRNNRREAWFATGQASTKENADSFAGLHNANSTACMIFDEACHRADTEVLTDSGWKLFPDVLESDKLLTMDPITHKAEYIKPRHIIANDYDGGLYTYEKRGVNFAVTPNHRMFVTTGKGVTRFTEIQELGTGAAYTMHRHVQLDNPDVATFTIPEFDSGFKQFPAVTVDGDVWAEFLGWFYSEGSIVVRTTRTGRVCKYATCITQKNLAPVLDVCKRLGYPYKIYERTTTPSVRIHNMALAEHLGQFGRYCLDKRVPRYLFSFSARQIELFLDAFCQGDGYYKTPSRRILYTSCKGLADDLQELALLAGYNSTVTTRSLTGKTAQFATHVGTSSVDGYVVSVSASGQKAYLRMKDVGKELYKGRVYCAELPKHHLLYTRLNGTALWSGNSAIPSEIYEVANGAMTDGEPMMFLFGNPTKSTGYFADTFGRLRHRWINWQVDSRTAKMTNKELINQWVEDYGEDSDFVRVRVRGQFPRVGDSQFISTEVVEQAMERHVEPVETDPIIIGVDVARFGDDQSVFVVVRGRKLLSIRAYRELDLMELSARVVELIKEFSPHAVFVDGAGVGAGVVDRLHQLQYKVIEVQAGSKAEDPEKFCNKRAEMWWRMRDWLKTADIPRDALALKYDLTGIEYAYDAKMRIQLEKKSDMKKRGLASPDFADALAMAFAEPVNPVSRPRRYDWQKKHKKELNWRVL